MPPVTGRVTLKAEDDEEKEASLEIGGDAKIPSWVPQYPGSHPRRPSRPKANRKEGTGEAGKFTFKTDDSRRRYCRFYEQKAREMGMTLRTTTATRCPR